MKEVLNGGYNVHPVPPPNSEIKERIRKRYEREEENQIIKKKWMRLRKKISRLKTIYYFPNEEKLQL